MAAGSNGSVAICRFFDALRGAHFFVANAAGALTVEATRSDLAYEPQSTFLRAATWQAGDVGIPSPAMSLYAKAAAFETNAIRNTNGGFDWG